MNKNLIYILIIFSIYTKVFKRKLSAIEPIKKKETNKKEKEAIKKKEEIIKKDEEMIKVREEEISMLMKDEKANHHLAFIKLKCIKIILDKLYLKVIEYYENNKNDVKVKEFSDKKEKFDIKYKELKSVYLEKYGYIYKIILVIIILLFIFCIYLCCCKKKKNLVKTEIPLEN